ncbi:primosomal protein N' [Natronoglycomyces albus]|uniref:Probable replication restart protein PriA n=1 Tax=Natronoglycomyces albus TaxID=2811108 RepID=A0A895XSH5_9ACTN|nr:primosomal protein N' [Natronoglycomyces albus]QSB06622.1 primosomal protein N' [Natronoglycomyces albus]
MTHDPGVAAVCLEQPLPHLDRVFDYRIPDKLRGTVHPGSRVRVTFAGRLVSGYVLELKDSSDYTGKLTDLKRVITSEPVLSAEILQLAEVVAQRYAGTRSDVLRLAVPQRRASVEKEPPPDPAPVVQPPDSSAWARYQSGEAFLRALCAAKAPRAVWDALPGEDWPARFAEAAAATASSGRGAVLVVPDQTDLDRLDEALRAQLGPGCHVTLSATLGPTKRYRAFLTALRGGVNIVAGTRAAGFAPVTQVGLVAIWDDGDEVHGDPHAPYPHAREVLLTRAASAGAGCLLGGFARTANAQLLVESQFAVSLTPAKPARAAALPRVVPVGDDEDLERDPDAVAARMPTVAWQAARAALRAGSPVLVQVPRRGYVPAVACQRCRSRCQCPRCDGPLRLVGASRAPVCSWCGVAATNFRCPHCASSRLRAQVIGQERTGEELSQAFPEVPVHFSSGVNRIDSVDQEPAVVVATPGVEPVASGGYGAVLLLDTWALLARASLTAGEEALRRWMAAASLARPASAGGTVVVVADGGLPVVQALLRWDAAWFAGRELAERSELRFPPISRMAVASGSPAQLEAFAHQVRQVAHSLGVDVEELGPVPVDQETERLLWRVPRRCGPALSQVLAQVTRSRSEAKAPPIRVQVDPRELF